MFNIIKVTLFLAALLMPIAGFSQDKLPIGDEVFVRSQDDCSLLKKGELDFIEFTVEKNGRSFSFPEVACVVAEIKNIRKNRYHVVGDCQEFDTVFVSQFFLDILPSKNIRIDGDELVFCDWDGSIQKSKTVDPIRIIPIEKPQDLVDALSGGATDNVDKLLKQWEIEENNCRGNSGDDPETWKACDRRYIAIQALEKAGWCLGKEDQSRSEMTWHKCEHNSIRSSD